MVKGAHECAYVHRGGHGGGLFSLDTDTARSSEEQPCSSLKLKQSYLKEGSRHEKKRPRNQNLVSVFAPLFRSGM